MNAISNPYTLIFGKEPSQLLSRYPETFQIIDDFSSDPPSHQIFMLTGVRGSGKTVMMTSIAKHFKTEEDWFVIDLSPDLDLLESFAAELGEIKELNKVFRLEGLSLALAGITISLSNNAPVTDAKIAITKMLQIVKKHHKKVLVTLDEAVNNESVRKFASVFQILLRQDLPVYLIMTGLYENIHSLQNEKTLTFLYRAPKVEMKPLNMRSIAQNYKENLSLTTEAAREMAELTNGYPFAFQVLGYLTWIQKGDYHAIINEYRGYLEDYVYEKIWTEMSQKDRQVTLGIAQTGNGRTDEIKQVLGLKQNEWNPYRKRLLDKGIIVSNERGKVAFTLPFWKEYVLEYYGELV